MNIKVLPLAYWMKIYPKGMKGHELPESEGFFNKDGYYLYGDKCWFEKNGKCYHYDAGSFKYSLELLNLPIYSEKEYNALLEMRKVKLLTKQQLYILNRIERIKLDEKSIRKIKSSSLQRLKKYRKLAEEKRNGTKTSNDNK